jgi:hypothetical protein
MENNTSHGMKQQLPRETHNKPENTNATKKSTKNRIKMKTKNGQLLHTIVHK